MPFAAALPTYDKTATAQRTGVNYVKFDEAYRVTLRILNPESRVVYKHFIEQANGGRGTSVVCPNITAQTRVCPVELAVAGLPKDDPDRKAANARRRYVVNVLDRTPYTTCSTCDTFTPGTKCSSCGAALKNHDFKPLNKIKILEGGPRLFLDSLEAIDKMQREDLNDIDITEYDITFTTSGKGRDKKISALPRDPSPLAESDLLDAETGEPQKVYSLDDLSEPTQIEEIKLQLRGASIDELNAWRDENKVTPF